MLLSSRRTLFFCCIPGILPSPCFIIRITIVAEPRSVAFKVQFLCHPSHPFHLNIFILMAIPFVGKNIAFFRCFLLFGLFHFPVNDLRPDTGNLHRVVFVDRINSLCHGFCNGKFFFFFKFFLFWWVGKIIKKTTRLGKTPV